VDLLLGDRDGSLLIGEQAHFAATIGHLARDLKALGAAFALDATFGAAARPELPGITRLTARVIRLPEFGIPAQSLVNRLLAPALGEILRFVQQSNHVDIDARDVDLGVITQSVVGRRHAYARGPVMVPVENVIVA